MSERGWLLVDQHSAGWGRMQRRGGVNAEQGLKQDLQAWGACVHAREQVEP